MCKNYRKVDYDTIKEEEFKLQDFFECLTLSKARTIFSVKVNMIHAPMNYMSDPMNSGEGGWLCKSCDDKLLCSTNHLKVCSRFRHLQNIDWTDDAEVAIYFQVISG